MMIKSRWTRSSGRGPALAVIVVALMLAASITQAAGPSEVSPAATWGTPLTLASGTGLSLEDAAFRGARIAVEWTRPLSGPGETLVERRSSNGGTSFGPATVLRRHVRQPAVAICADGTRLAAFGHWHADPGAWLIDLFGTPGTTHRTVSAAGARYPDVVCPDLPQVAWAAWIEDSGGTDVFKVVRATTTDPGLPSAIIVGPAESAYGGPVLVPSGTGVLVVYPNEDGDVVGRRVTHGGLGLTMSPEIVIGDGSPAEPAGYPVIGSSGDRVVVAWTKCADVWGRVSGDGGTGWASARKLRDYACPGEEGGLPRSAAIRGSRVAITYSFVGPAGDHERLVTSTDTLGSFTNARLSGPMDETIAGFTRVSGNTRLGLAYDPGSSVRFRRCSGPICGGF